MSVYLDQGDVVLHQGDVLDVLRAMPEASVDCCITSPPYFGLRDYGVEGQIGLEDTPEAFVGRLVDVFAEVRRVLAPYGTCWVNMGDSYAANRTYQVSQSKHQAHDYGVSNASTVPDGLKPKDLMLMPARLALALQDDGWWLRSDVIWSKPNPMPESVTDRPTSAHEHVFLLTKAPRYWYDAEAVREADGGKPAGNGFAGRQDHRLSGGLAVGGTEERWTPGGGRNLRNVWTIATEPTPEAHFATFPTELVRLCVEAGCAREVCEECGEPRRRLVERVRTLDGEPLPDEHPLAFSAPDEPHRVAPNGVGHWRYAAETRTAGWTDCGHGAYRPGRVLDPFMGSGTTAIVARRLGRHAVGVDLSADYLAIAEQRLAKDRARRWVAPGPRAAVDEGQLTMDGAA